MTPDICMCRGEDCPDREHCHRYTAAPTLDWQSYFVVSPGGKNTENGLFHCEHFWPAKESEK